MELNRNTAETWEKAYEAFQQINFKAWDFDSIKESLLDYIKLYYPEDFSDYIETSELVTIIETFAYISELLAYRIDLNSHENFITTAERKESILRLAKYISYNASRNLPARGLVKITSITTTESITDSNGLNLANRTIKWNDPDNPNWKEQFLLVINRVTKQEFGTVLPSDRVQTQDLLFELYDVNNRPITNNILKYNVNVSGQTYPMELVPATLNEFGPLEKRPEKDLSLSFIYSQDGLGDSSDNTGFFMFTKQGTLRRRKSNFDGVTPNQTWNVNDTNVNNIDVWLNNIDPDTEEIIATDEDEGDVRDGEWQQIELANAQNLLFNILETPNKFEIETRDNDSFRVIFGDGNFANIPSGAFEVWYRTSANESLVIPSNSIQNNSSNFSYFDSSTNSQTFSFTFSLFNPIQNAAPSESLERIREVAPSVYYTQNRMVNGRDYNEFPLQDNSILKIRSINRTFAGDSKFMGWHDPKEYYENVKIFGDDLVIYFRTDDISNNILPTQLPAPDGGLSVQLVDTLIQNHILPVIRSYDIFSRFILEGLEPKYIRSEFTQQELEDLEDSLRISIFNAPNTSYLTFNVTSNQEESFWQVDTNNEPDDWWISMESQADNGWILTYRPKHLIVNSEDTNFYVTNERQKVITYDTLRTNRDEIVILAANTYDDGNTVTALDRNYKFAVLAKDTFNVGENLATCNVNQLQIVPLDENNDGIPDNISLNYLISEDDYVYFNREDLDSPWQVVEPTQENIASWEDDENDLWKRESGKYNVNFLWLHRTPRYHLIDPSPTNLIDSFVITRGYYSSLRLWLNNLMEERPEEPTAYQLRNDYGYLLQNKMISDNVIFHTGKIKIIIGSKAPEELQAFIKVVRTQNRALTDNRIKTRIVSIVNEFFDINKWEFGQTFYFTELSTYIHNRLSADIESVVLVPKSSQNVFGTMFQVFAEDDEIIQPNITVDDIEIVQSLNPKNLQQRL